MKLLKLCLFLSFLFIPNQAIISAAKITDDINKLEDNSKKISNLLDTLNTNLIIADLYFGDMTNVYDSHEPYKTNLMSDEEKKCWEQLIKLATDKVTKLSVDKVHLEAEKDLNEFKLDVLLKRFE